MHPDASRPGRATPTRPIRTLVPVGPRAPERRLPPRAAPNDGVAWPDEPCPDPAAEKVRQLALALAREMSARGLSARAVAALAGIGVGTVQVIQHGNRWPDTRAVARLENALDTALWPAHDQDTPARLGD